MKKAKWELKISKWVFFFRTNDWSRTLFSEPASNIQSSVLNYYVTLRENLMLQIVRSTIC